MRKTNDIQNFIDRPCLSSPYQGEHNFPAGLILRTGLGVVLCGLFLFLGACEDYPKDVEGTLENVQNSQTLRIGLIEHPPWVIDAASGPQGLEVNLLTEFAASLNAAPEWVFMSEAEATIKLKHYQLDIVAGGLTQNSPRKKTIGFTRPYLQTGDKKQDHHVMAVPQGENRFVTTLEKFLKTHQPDPGQLRQNEDSQ